MFTQSLHLKKEATLTAYSGLTKYETALTTLAGSAALITVASLFFGFTLSQMVVKVSLYTLTASSFAATLCCPAVDFVANVLGSLRAYYRSCLKKSPDSCPCFKGIELKDNQENKMTALVFDFLDEIETQCEKTKVKIAALSVSLGQLGSSLLDPFEEL